MAGRAGVRCGGAGMAALAAIALLSACATTPPPAPPPPPAPAPPPPPPRGDELAAIVGLLDRGEAAAASPRIDALLARDPQDADARLLRRSLDEDPRALLGAANYAYVVKPGETMADVSRRLLGNRLRFYALSRYNGIAVPATLAAGRSLRIPGTAPVKPRPPRRPPPPAPKTDPAAAQRLRGVAMQALRGGRPAEAIAALRRAAALDPANPLVRRDLDRLAPPR